MPQPWVVPQASAVFQGHVARQTPHSSPNAANPCLLGACRRHPDPSLALLVLPHRASLSCSSCWPTQQQPWCSLRWTGGSQTGLGSCRRAWEHGAWAYAWAPELVAEERSSCISCRQTVHLPAQPCNMFSNPAGGDSTWVFCWGTTHRTAHPRPAPPGPHRYCCRFELLPVYAAAASVLFLAA